jgi:hypothetical protein
MMDRLGAVNTAKRAVQAIDNIIDLKASPISSPTILKRPCQEKQQRAVISVVKEKGSSRI